jgi:hypothetical protein
MAPAPDLPRSFKDWLALPGKLDSYLHDHFGLRETLIHAYSIVTHLWMHSGNALVMEARDGRMFFRGDEMVRQSAGLILRVPNVVETADLLAQVRDELATRGIKLIVAPPPNASTIYPDMLPAWARNKGRPTEYDLLLHALAARGVPTADLRPPLRAARAQGKAFSEHDTHWTSRGAIAGFNAVATAAGHPNWQLDPDKVLASPALLIGGDLARMLGIAPDVSELLEPLSLPGGRVEKLSPEPFATYLATSDVASGPTILVIGDSFTAGYFQPMVITYASRFAWTHHLGCGVDWKWIDYFRPNEVWWMPTERVFLCAPGQRPKNMPHSGL